MGLRGFSERALEALAELTDPYWVFDFSRSIGPDKGVYQSHTEAVEAAGQGGLGGVAEALEVVGLRE